MDRIPQLKTCCCGCTLHTGCIVIGWMSMIDGLMRTIGVIVLIAVDPELPESGIYRFFIHEKTRTIIALLIIICILFVLRTLSCVALLIGIHKQKPRLFLPWIRCATTALVMEIINYLAIFFDLVYVYSFVIAVLSTSVSAYYILVVYSYYRELNSATSTLTVLS